MSNFFYETNREMGVSQFSYKLKYLHLGLCKESLFSSRKTTKNFNNFELRSDSYDLSCISTRTRSYPLATIALKILT